MSRNAKTLSADGLKVRCAANKRYAVAVPNPVKRKLQVTKRTDDVKVISAELRRIHREMPKYLSYVFDLSTGKLILKLWPEDTAPIDDSRVARAISNILGRS
jgi:hypothetical protein